MEPGSNREGSAHPAILGESGLRRWNLLLNFSVGMVRYRDRIVQRELMFKGTPT
jgi:hypothetical protein